MAVPLAAALGRVAMSGARFGAAEAGAARATVASRGASWRSAMQAAGGNKGVAREMMVQKASELREEERQRRQAAMDEARERRQMERQADRERQANQPGLFQQFKDNPGAAMANTGASIVKDNYRGLAGSMLPRQFEEQLHALGRLTDAINSRGRELAPFSGQLAHSGAMSDVRQMRADIYEAKVAGGSYSRVMDESSKLQTGLQEAFAPLKDEIAKGLADLIGFAREFMPEFKALALWLRDRFIEVRAFMETLPLVIGFASRGQIGAAEDAMREGFRQADLDQKWAHRRDKERESQGRDPFQSWWEDPLLQLPDASDGRWNEPARVPGGGRMGFDFFGV